MEAQLQSATTFKRSLKLYHLTILGVAYMTPMIVYGIYGVIAATSQGQPAGAFTIGVVAMFFTAYSYCHMVKAFPVAGSSYTFTRKGINPKLGFMTGWLILLDYLFIPMAIWLIGSSYFEAAVPSVPRWAWVLIFIAVTTGLNVVGMKIGANVNIFLVLIQIMIILAFIIFSIKAVMAGMGEGAITTTPFFNPDVPFDFVVAGAAISCYCYLGFDAITTFVEEAVEPEKNIPRAIMLTLLICGVAFVAASFFTALAHPSYDFANVDNASYEVAKVIAPPIFASILLAGVIIAQFASGVSAQASGARLLYAMGRDGVLPKKVFGVLNARFNTPVRSILVTGAVALLATTLDVTTSTSFINFGAFIAYILVNVSVISHYFIRKKERGAGAVIKYLIFPFLGAALVFYLLIHLDMAAVILGCCWAVVGFIILLYLTKMFKKDPPEMTIDE
ncbi:MAG: APC family permease [Clostridiales Family XIII bacterium]|jgi:amino acid transporter|nr:APC family permease [Clostridiales Family XIII bacterium]